MADFIDVKYSQMLSNRYDKFVVKNTNPLKINFRCPFCNDSKKSKSKARGWILESKETNSLGYYCHNCFKSLKFSEFLKQQDHMLYREYVTERFMDGKNTNVGGGVTKPVVYKTFAKKTLVSEIKADDDIHLSKISKVSELPHEHPALVYVKNRQIPIERYADLFYVKKFKEWVNTIIPDKFPNVKRDEPRLIIPFKDKNGVMFGFAARSFDPKSVLRYITIMIDTNQHKFFGLNTVDFSKRYYVLEGAIDSFFIKNSIAMAGADADVSSLEKLENCVVVMDNEPRNKDVCNKMKKLMMAGIKVCVWPSHIEQKDINAMICDGGYTSERLTEIINKSAIGGMMGVLELNKWKKVGR